MNSSKAVAALLAATTSLFLHVPMTLHRTALVALYFVIGDTVTGYLCSRQAGGAASSALRNKLKDKLLCYSMLLLLTSGLSFAAQSWSWLEAGWWAVMGAETLSICENLRGLLSRVGGQWGPVAALLDRIIAFVGAQPNLGTSANSTTLTTAAVAVTTITTQKAGAPTDTGVSSPVAEVGKETDGTPPLGTNLENQ